MSILDRRFEQCRPKVSHSIFKEGNPHHIDIEIEKLFLQVDEELELYLNDNMLAKVKVKRNK